MEIIDSLIQIFSNFVNIILHLDAHLNEWASMFGPTIYVILFLVIFCETGLVVTPFLPGDSLLFALGAMTTTENSVLSLPILLVTLTAAGIIGDAVNYYIGKWFGPKVFKSEKSRFLNKEHLVRTQNFYERYGGKTIIFARFIPIIRTFAPFVAGIGAMKYSRFVIFNITGAIAWVFSFLLAGNYFGNLPAVKNNFHLVIFAIIFVSMLPPLVEYLRAKRSVLT